MFSYKYNNHIVTHLHVSNTVAAFLCQGKNGNEYNGDLHI